MADKNIDPLQDIDFEALGLMTPEFQNDPDPETPPAPKKEDPKSDPKAAADPDPEDPDPAADPDDGDPDPDDPLEPKTPADDPDDPEKGKDKSKKKKAKGDDDDPDPDDPDPDDPDPDDPDPDDPPERTVVSELIELVGYEDLNPEDYTDTVEGLGKLVQASAERMTAQKLDQTFEAYPEVEQFFDFVANGGDPDEYHKVRGQALDYSKMAVDEENEAQQERLVRQALSQDEYEDEEIDSMVDKYKAGGILKDQAEMALKGLKRQHAKRQQQLTEQQKQIREQQQEEISEFWDTVETTLQEKDTFKGITIPKNERQKFFDYISKPVQDGYSQRDIDAMELGLEEKIAIDYLIMKGFPLGDLVDKKAASKAASELRDRIKSGGDPKPRKSSPPKPAAKDGKPSIADLDLINF